MRVSLFETAISIFSAFLNLSLLFFYSRSLPLLIHHRASRSFHSRNKDPLSRAIRLLRDMTGIMPSLLLPFNLSLNLNFLPCVLFFLCSCISPTFAYPQNSNTVVDNDAGASGADSGSFQLSDAAIGGICAGAGVVVVLGGQCYRPSMTVLLSSTLLDCCLFSFLLLNHCLSSCAFHRSIAVVFVLIEAPSSVHLVNPMSLDHHSSHPLTFLPHRSPIPLSMHQSLFSKSRRPLPPSPD